MFISQLQSFLTWMRSKTLGCQYALYLIFVMMLIFLALMVSAVNGFVQKTKMYMKKQAAKLLNSSMTLEQLKKKKLFTAFTHSGKSGQEK